MGSNPAGGRWEVRDGTVRKPAKRPGSNPGVLWVRLPPVLLADDFLGWCSSRRPVNPLPSGCEAEGGRFNSFTIHWRFSKKVRSSIGSGYQPLKLKRRVRFPHGLLHGTTRRVAELVDARASDARAPEAWEFESPPGDSTLQAGRCPAGPHKPGVPGSIPGPGTAGGPVLGRVS